MKPRAAGVLLAASLVGLALAAPAAAGQPPGREATIAQESGSRVTALRFSGTCIDAIFPVAVELERVRAAVPASYSIFLGAVGRAILYVSAVSCDDAVVDGVAGGPAIYSDLLVQVEPPPGSGTPIVDHFLDGYWVWLVTDEPRVHARLTGLGMFVGLDEQVSFTPLRVGDRLTGFAANFAWSHSPFRLRGSVHGVPPVQPPPFQNRFWHDGPRGQIESRLNFSDAQFQTAQLTLTTPLGSPLAQLLGKQCAADPGSAKTCSVGGPGLLAPRVHFEHDVRAIAQRRGASTQAARTCLARRSPIGPRNIGRVRLRYSRRRLVRLPVKPVRRTRRSFRYCVKRSKGRVSAVFSRRGRVVLVATSARGHGNRGVRPGRRARALRARYPRRRALGRGLYRAGPASPRLIRIRRGRVRFVAVADRRLLRNLRSLRRHLRLAGL